MTLGEIARRLYKRGWADALEHKQALAALGRLSVDQIAMVENLGKKYE